ncbi:hypothetical protein CVIRNUC_006153 [Coccomyxa viridis]|uniref:Uncharacterized protein n=1 Tax=Coccomyxa viridis TaxID=1274662 RepID=A0AAV1I6I1_9CHLO|nr:hypothetical protein CVIRNUC_006153 [Coccomyxa viridis]
MFGATGATSVCMHEYETQPVLVPNLARSPCPKRDQRNPGPTWVGPRSPGGPSAFSAARLLPHSCVRAGSTSIQCRLIDAGVEKARDQLSAHTSGREPALLPR